MISAQLYTVRKLLKEKSNVEHVLKTIKDMGYEGVQLSGIGVVDESLAILYKEICEKLELKIVATHFGLEDLEARLNEIVHFHQLWQCQHVGVGAMPASLRSVEKLDEFIERMETVAKKLSKHQMKLIYHNHKFEFEKVGDITWMDHLLNEFKVTEFELDTYWLQCGGVSPMAWIEKVAGKMDVIHLKDYKIINDQVTFAEVGQGNLDFKSIIKQAEDIGVTHYVVEQDESDDPLKSLAMSINYLQKLIFIKRRYD